MGFMKQPLVINLPVTEVCDSKCVMCNVWSVKKTDHFNRDKIQRLFGQKIFSKVKHIGLSGGEPTLNTHLIDITDELLNCLPNLQSLSITSHGYHTNRHLYILPQIKNLCSQKGVTFSLNISLDGFEESHNKIRRVSDAFRNATETIKAAREIGISVQIQCTVSSLNAYNIVLLREYAIENDFEIVFRIATEIARLSNSDLISSISLSDHQKSFVSDFLLSERTIFVAKSLSRRLFYFDLARRLISEQDRKAPCIFQTKGLFVSPDGRIYNCSRSEKELILPDIENISTNFDSVENNTIASDLVNKTCVKCFHDQSGRWPILKYITVHNKIYPLLNFFKKVLRVPNIISKLFFVPKRIDTENVGHNKILIIGMYGGEHVGDAAILGGVILRSIDKFKCNSFDVVSIRPDRTKFWISNITLPNTKINVVSNSHIDFKQYDAIVLGGGPLMGIPGILSNHISILKKAKRKHIPFYIEGIGYGPINDFISKLLIKKIIRTANQISIRTETDFYKALKISRKVEVSYDPAFDYLNFISTQNLIIQDSLKSIIDTSKDIWVINLRPLWNRYSENNNQISINIIDVLANTMAKYKQNKRFVFMPMNSDQFGFSDLEIAYKLLIKTREVDSNIDFVVWETEPNIESCLALLKKASLTISMRFHGCIFSLASNVPTIGLDYSTSENGKVYFLFKDLHLEQDVINIKDITQESLTAKISNILEN